MILLRIIGFILIACQVVSTSKKDEVSKKRIFIASDHRGYELKERIIILVNKLHPYIDIEDMGPYDTQTTDYTMKALSVVKKVSEYQKKTVDSDYPLPIYSEDIYGVLICMDGIGMDIAGNYFGFPSKIFTANCRTIEDAITAREHNDARILALSSQFSEELAIQMVNNFISTQFSGLSNPIENGRHIDRILNITEFVNKNCEKSSKIISPGLAEIEAKSIKNNGKYSDLSSMKALTNLTKSSNDSYRSYHENIIKIMAEDIKQQFSDAWKSAELLLKPMIDLSSPCSQYSCSASKSKIISKTINWRPYRDEVGETRVTSFRAGVISFWTRVVGIKDYDVSEHEYETGKISINLEVDVFKNLFIEKIQPFLINKWKLYDVIKDISQEKVNKMFWIKLQTKYSGTLNILKTSFGSKSFFSRFSKNEEYIKNLENEHLPYIAFMAEEIMYPITSYTDHGFLCYAYLNQRNVLSPEADQVLYKAHLFFTLAIHRALVLLKLADINSLSGTIPEEKQCTRFFYRTLTLPGTLNSFDPYQLKLSLQNTSFSTHPIGALLVFQTVWCIRLRDDSRLTRVMIINPSDNRLSRVAGLSKHPSEFEVIVPAFSEYIISVDPNVIHHNNVGWTELINIFKKLIMDNDKQNKFAELFAGCGELVQTVLSHESENEETRTWWRRNVPRYSNTAKCMYQKISKLASEDGTSLVSKFILDFSIADHLKTNSRITETNEYKNLLKIFKSLTIEGPEGESVLFWDEIEKQLLSAHATSSQLKEFIQNEYCGDIEKYILEYSALLCIELWWFGFKFADDQLQRSRILSRPATMIPNYFYSVIFSFGIIVPLEATKNENYCLSLTKIAEGTTSLIGIDNDGWIWKLFKTENTCKELQCPCDKRDIFSAAKQEYEISSVIHSENSYKDQLFVESHFIEAVLAGRGNFDLINNGGVEISFLKMKQTKGDTFYQFIMKNRPNEFGIIPESKLTDYIESIKYLSLQGLEILVFLKMKKIVHMDFHESNAIINESVDGKKNLVLIDFGLSECYDSNFHNKNMVILNSKSYLPTVGKGRFAVSKLFSNPLYIHDLQIFCTRFIENGILGMSSRLPNIFDRRKMIGSHFPEFTKYLSLVKDILVLKENNEIPFLEQIANALLARSRVLSTSMDTKSKILIESFSYQLYLNMKTALLILNTPELTEFFNIWIQTFYVDSPEKIGITNEENFPTSSSLLDALKNGKNCDPSEQLLVVIQSIQKFVNTAQKAFLSINNVYNSFLDREPEMNEKIQRIAKKLLEIRRKEILTRTKAGHVVRADPIPRVFVSCQGSYNPPTKAHLFLAHEGRKRALKIYANIHSEDLEMIECNETNVFGILSTIATFEVMEKDYPEQSFTVEERQGFLRHLTGTKSVDFVSGESPYDKYNDWSWLHLDYSGHSGGQIKNSSKFLAESETIELIFLITFSNSKHYPWILSDDIASKISEFKAKYLMNIADINLAYDMIVNNENSLNLPLENLNIKIFDNNLKLERTGIFMNENHFRYIENIFREVLIQQDRIETKGNYRLFAISGEPRNSNDKHLYLGMADLCPRDLKLDQKSFNVSSTKIRKFLQDRAETDALEFIEDSLVEKINCLHALFEFVNKFIFESDIQSEFTSAFLARIYLNEQNTSTLAIPKLSYIPLKKTVFRESYTALPISVTKLTMFMEFGKPEELDQSSFFITGVFDLHWNDTYYPNGHENMSDLLSLDGKLDFLEVYEINLLEFNLKPEYFITDDKLIFSDGFIRKILKQTSHFRIAIKAKIRSIGKNRSGRGLYLSGKQKNEHMALTLMEPFGFSNLFYMQDRPDVLALYDIILLNYPFKNTMLAGGDFVSMKLFEYLETENLRDMKHGMTDQEIIIASDKKAKPTYLFQLIFLPYESEEELQRNGKMIITSLNGVTIRLVRESVGKLDDTTFALESLNKVMEFDQNFNGHHYDSKNLTLVAATDFNSGAREMRNFMVFSPSKLLASPNISTIDDYYNVERIVAHEYLHHVSGNRVTMRDFFEVTLKEGLTVLRDMYFRENVGIFGKCSRIEAVTKLRKTQYVQDSGPKAHSVRPNSIENKGDFEVSLFTTTVYEKGAEIMRMIQELIEPNVMNFSRILGNYLSGPIRPSTIEELVDSFNLETRLPHEWFKKKQFMKWFLVKGTPTVTVDWKNLDSDKSWELSVSQITRNGNDSSIDTEMLIPIRIGFFNGKGKEMKEFKILHESGLVWVHNDLFVLYCSNGKVNINFGPDSLEIIPSINRAFSSPIKVDYTYNYKAGFLAKFESDPMSRFDAFQFLLKSAIYKIYQGNKVDTFIKEISELIKYRLSCITGSSGANILKYWASSRLIAGEIEKEQEKLELALSLEEMYLSNLVEDFDTSRFGLVDPVKLSDAREMMQKMLSDEMFDSGDEITNYEFLVNELDPVSHPGSVKLDQVLLRTYTNSRELVEKLSKSAINPSMERQIALLECRYRIYKSAEDRKKLLQEFNDYVSQRANDHPVAKEKLFKFVILKSSNAQELKEFIQKFNLLIPTQPQSLKLFAKEFASNNLSVFHSVDGLRYMSEVITNCDKFGNHETAATLIKHSFEVNLLKLNQEAKLRVVLQLKSMLIETELSPKLVNSIESLLKQLIGK